MLSEPARRAEYDARRSFQRPGPTKEGPGWLGLPPSARRIVATALVLMALLFLFRFGAMLVRALWLLVLLVLEFFAATRGTPYGLAVFLLLLVAGFFGIRVWRRAKSKIVR